MTQPPATIRAGETISYVASKYSAESYTLKVAFNNGADEPLVVTGEADGTQFDVNTEAPAKPGRYAWAEVYTKTADGSVVYGPQGYMEVLPSILSKSTPSHAQQMVETLKAGLLALAGTDKSSVSINGQSFNRVSVSEYQEQLVYWESRVKQEQDAAAAASGNIQSRFIHVNFTPPQIRFPFCQ